MKVTSTTNLHISNDSKFGQHERMEASESYVTPLFKHGNLNLLIGRGFPLRTRITLDTSFLVNGQPLGGKECHLQKSVRNIPILC
jgi:hypothetical protein